MTAYLVPVAPGYLVPEPERTVPAAVVSPEHLVTGLCASLGGWRPDQFEEFLAWFAAGHDGGPLPLRLDHHKWRTTPRGAEAADVGECLRFASVPASEGFPGGLLVLAALFPDFAPPVLGGMRSYGQWLALSVGGQEYGADLLIREVSLVDKVGNQADPDALVIGTGHRAVAAWELLTGTGR